MRKGSSRPTQPPTNKGRYIGAGNKPFDASVKADIVIRSINSVDFFVLKIILSLASPVFDGMFSDAGEGAETKNGLPIIDLAEDSDTLYNLLLLVYPYAKEPTNTLETYMKVGIAAQKYAMDEVLQRLGKLVGRCEAIVKKPLGSFALAVHFGWTDVIKDAARNTLAVPLCEFKGGDELRMVTGADFVDLLQWRFACQQETKEMLPANSSSGVGLVTTPSRLGRHEMLAKLQERSRDTGCPRSSVLMNEHIIAQGLDSVTSSGRSNSEIERISEYREVIENAKSLGKEIDEKIAKVPFKIRNRWVVAPIQRAPAVLVSHRGPDEYMADLGSDDIALITEFAPPSCGLVARLCGGGELGGDELSAVLEEAPSERLSSRSGRGKCGCKKKKNCRK